jgi:hypothetical protein
MGKGVVGPATPPTGRWEETDMKLRDIPTRVSTGGFILHSGWEKWKADEQTAKAIHGMAAGAFPFLQDIPPERFLKLLAAGEIATGVALLVPQVPTVVAGAALTGFSGGLAGFYFRTPGLRREGSIWPTQQGLGVSKDAWLLGIGLGLLAEGISTFRRHRRTRAFQLVLAPSWRSRGSGAQGRRRAIRAA